MWICHLFSKKRCKHVIFEFTGGLSGLNLYKQYCSYYKKRSQRPFITAEIIESKLSNMYAALSELHAKKKLPIFLVIKYVRRCLRSMRRKSCRFSCKVFCNTVRKRAAQWFRRGLVISLSQVNLELLKTCFSASVLFTVTDIPAHYECNSMWSAQLSMTYLKKKVINLSIFYNQLRTVIA